MTPAAVDALSVADFLSLVEGLEAEHRELVKANKEASRG